MADGFFAGQIDEARIWSTARSQSEIQASMNTEIGPTNGLLGLWHLNATSGTTAADGAGNSTLNNGTVTPTATWSPGIGMPFPTTSGLQLNGTNQYVTMGASPGLRSSTFTVELWFRRTATGLGTSTGTGGVTAIPLITKGRAEGESATQDVNYFFGIDTVTGKLAADFEEAQTGASPSLNHPIVGNTVVTSNVWHQAAATYDGTTWRLYLDGAADGFPRGWPAGERRRDVGHRHRLGAHEHRCGRRLLRRSESTKRAIWNGARSSGQIQSTINSEVSTAAGLVGSWHLNDGSGTVAADSSGGGINGATVAAPTWTYGMLLGAAPTNQAPVVDAVTINQTSPHTSDTLSAAVTSHDPDGDTLTTQYQWTKNGTDIPGATNPTLNTATAGNGDRGDVMRVRVTVSDASLTSTPLTSAPVTILNTAPSASVALDDHAPGTNATLTATATSTDLDGDTVVLTYVWKVNGATRQTTTTTSLTDTFDLSQTGNGNNGQSVSVTVTPNDGTVDGAPVTDSATVGNAVPLVDTVVIDQASPHTDDTLTATVTSHDADGDALTTSYQWIRNGNDISGETGATLDLSAAGNGDRGDVIRVRVTVSDGAATSAPVTSAPVSRQHGADRDRVAGRSLAEHERLVDGERDHERRGRRRRRADVRLARRRRGTADDTEWRTERLVRSVARGSRQQRTERQRHGHAERRGRRRCTRHRFRDRGNAAPVVDSVAIDQASPRTNDTLAATVTSHDPDGDVLVTSYQWTKNGVDLVGETGATLELATVGSGDRGDLIRVSVSVSDGTASSAPVTSSSVIVANTSPSATVTLDDPSPATSATVTATATTADADGDDTSLTYVWRVDGTTRQITVTSSLTDGFDLSLAGNGDNGQIVTVTVTPTDGTDDGSPVTDTATVGNATPVVDSVTIDQTSPRTNDVLSATVTSHDPDGDALTTSYQWTMNGGDIAGATASTLDLSLAGDGNSGDQIRVRVIVADASLSSSPVTSSPVAIANTAPTATVTLNDHSPNTSATLTANASVNDADADGVTLTYVWRVDGTVRQTTPGAALSDSFDLSLAGNGDNGQIVTVTVTPNDGTDDGVPVADSASVGNAAPVVDSVAIGEASPRTNDTLTAAVTSHDPDGDPLTTDYQWTKNGVDISGATTATLESVCGRQREQGRRHPGARDRLRRRRELGSDHLRAGDDPEHRAGRFRGTQRSFAEHQRDIDRDHHCFGRGPRHRHAHVRVACRRGRSQDDGEHRPERHVRPLRRRERQQRTDRDRYRHAFRRDAERRTGCRISRRSETRHRSSTRSSSTRARRTRTTPCRPASPRTTPTVTPSSRTTSGRGTAPTSAARTARP